MGRVDRRALGQGTEENKTKTAAQLGSLMRGHPKGGDPALAANGRLAATRGG